MEVVELVLTFVLGILAALQGWGGLMLVGLIKDVAVLTERIENGKDKHDDFEARIRQLEGRPPASH